MNCVPCTENIFAKKRIVEDKKLIELFGEIILDETEEYRKHLFSFYTAVTLLAENPKNFEFNC